MCQVLWLNVKPWKPFASPQPVAIWRLLICVSFHHSPSSWDTKGYHSLTSHPGAVNQFRKEKWSGWPQTGLVQLRFGSGTVPEVLVFASGGSFGERLSLCFKSRQRRFQLRLPENNSGRSGSAAGSWKDTGTVRVLVPGKELGWDVCRTKLPPKMFWTQYEKWFEKRKRGSEKRSETWPKMFKPLSCCLNIFHQHFSKNISLPKICTTKKSRRDNLQGWTR